MSHRSTPNRNQRSGMMLAAAVAHSIALIVGGVLLVLAFFPERLALIGGAVGIAAVTFWMIAHSRPGSSAEWRKVLWCLTALDFLAVALFVLVALGMIAMGVPRTRFDADRMIIVYAAAGFGTVVAAQAVLELVGVSPKWMFADDSDSEAD